MNVAIEERAAYVVGAGVRTPIGCSLRAISAGARAGLSAYARHPFARDTRGERAVVARARWLDVDLPLAERIAGLAAEAAREAFEPLAGHAAGLSERFKVFLALSEDNVVGAADLELVVGRVASGLGLPAARVSVEPILAGHAGGLWALERACREVQSGKSLFALAGGADSYVAPERLLSLSARGRLHSSWQSWGFTPGEGAGFWAVTSGAAAQHFRLAPLGEVAGVAAAREEKLLGTRTVNIGEGLTEAFRGVLSGLLAPGPRVTRYYGDLNGEPYRADELAFALCRTAPHFDDPRGLVAPAEHWGDVGAASAPLAGALALAAFARERGRRGATLVFSSSAERSLRAAALFRPCGRAGGTGIDQGR